MLFNRRLPVLEGLVTRLMDNSVTADMVYLHFAKAFDSVNYRSLLDKIESFGHGKIGAKLFRFHSMGITFRVQVAE